MPDFLKFAFALLLGALGVAGFYYFADYPMVVRVLSVLAGLGAFAAVAWFTEQGQVFFDFSRDAVNETKKVVWPSNKETLQTTAIVFGFVLVMAIMLWVTDKTVEWLIFDLILGRKL